MKTKMTQTINAEITPITSLNKNRVYYNFGAGPAMLPVDVMVKAQEEFTNWHGTGMSIMEMSHRSEEFIAVAAQAEQDLRDLLDIPANYRVLFLQGGATSQFAMVPLNLLRGKNSADYLHTGLWSGKALKEATRFCKINVAASSEENNFTSIPDPDTWKLSKDAAYVYCTDNETIHGVEFHYVPETGDIPLVSDMTSNLLSKPLDVKRYGIIFAGAQKNVGPAGLVVVIIREDLLGNAEKNIPSMFDYALHDKEQSMLNTPPTFGWYIAGLVFQWVKANGGVKEMQNLAKQKSRLLYDFIDSTDFYNNQVDPCCRSAMNVPFTLRDNKLEGLFLEQSREAGLLALAGHRSVGGMRASIYNAMPVEGVTALIDFMQNFAKENG